MVRGDGLRLVAFGLAVLCAQVAHAEGVRSPFPVAARARLDLRVVTGDATSPWAWNTQSRSPLDGSRFMTDVTAGRDATGVAYLKAAANWKDTDDALGRVAFTIEQGEYLYRRL
ncbi:MAG TPA: hypothetical protein VFX92_06890, partial [Candidatus Krumholzibacteria bacterium]|nr:hypothetical protein [Candidatus Krumholzibacteria bacterium]